MHRRFMRMKLMSKLDEFISQFGVKSVGEVIWLRRECFLIRKEDHELAEQEIFGLGIYLGEDKGQFHPSPALIELIAARTQEHKVVVDERAAWLFLCGRDILDKGALSVGEPTALGLFLVQNEHDENLGFGVRKKGMVVKNILDRGFYLRRER